MDTHYRTIASRRARALVGVSAGGYGAVLLALHHLETYSVVESWSGYFHPTDPDGTSPLDGPATEDAQRVPDGTTAAPDAPADALEEGPTPDAPSTAPPDATADARDDAGESG